MKLKLSKDSLRNSSKHFVPWATGCLVLLLPGARVFAQDSPEAKGVVPANHAILSDTLSGSYFVAKPLKDQYDRLLARLELLKRELDEERVSGPQAQGRLDALREDLKLLRLNMEATKVLVPVAKVH